VGRTAAPAISGMQRRLQSWKGGVPSKPAGPRIFKELQSDVKFKIKMKKKRRNYFDAMGEQADTFFR
jgi:hypothetical protein